MAFSFRTQFIFIAIIFGIFVYGIVAVEAADRENPPIRSQLITIVCKCFVETKSNPNWDYFGYAYGSGTSNEEAYEAAFSACIHKPAVVRDGGATQVRTICE